MTATIREGSAVGSPVEQLGTLGTGRPNKLLLRDYANDEGWLFRVETDVYLDTQKEFDDLRGWLELPQNPATNQEIVRFLHSKVETTKIDPHEKDKAKKMFSAGFGLLP